MWEARQSTTPKIITLIDNNWNFYMCAKGEKYMIFEFEWIWRPANTKNNLENKVHDDQLTWLCLFDTLEKVSFQKMFVVTRFYCPRKVVKTNRRLIFGQSTLNF